MSGEQPAGSSAHVRRIVMLGASNIARNLSIVLATSRQAAGGPMDFIAATGHGRGYGMISRVLGRTLPSILDCELWAALEQRERLPTWGVLTDVGNDLIFGATTDQVAQWVEEALRRLRPYCEKLVMTGLPLAAVRSLGPARFRVFRLILFPSSPLTFETTFEHCCSLNTRLLELAQQYDASFLEPLETWYGWDPVHVTFRQAAVAWQHVFSQFADCSPNPWPPLSIRATALRVRPAYEKIFGVAKRQKQPAAHWRDGSAISLF